MTQPESFGKKYRDVLTGFEGISTGELTYYTGCHRILLQPITDDPKKVVESQSQWFDSVSLECLDETRVSLPGRIIEAVHQLIAGDPAPAELAPTGPGKEPPKR